MDVATRKIAVTRFLFYWLPVVVYAAFIFLVSSLPGKDIPGLFPGQDILFHLAEYAFFSFLICRAISRYYPQQVDKKRKLYVFILVFIYALTDEFHQSFVPGRTAALMDIIIDNLGSLIGISIYRWRK